jgi:hypothetical protein
MSFKSHQTGPGDAQSHVDAQFSDMKRSGRWREATMLLALGILVSVAFLNCPGTSDRIFWLIYMDAPRHAGLIPSYVDAVRVGASGHFTDYPPLGLLFLGLLGKIADLLQLNDFFVLKVSLALVTLLCATIASFWRGRWQPGLGIAMFLVIAIDSLLLVYIDVYFAVVFLLAFFLLERGYPAWGFAVFVAAFFIKWQPIVLAPFLLLYILPRPFNVVQLRRFIPAIAVVAIIYLVFGDAPLFAFRRGVTDTHFSGSALNLDWLITGAMRMHAGGLHDGVVRTVMFGNYPLLDSGIYSFLSRFSTAMRYITYAITLMYFYFSNRTVEELLRASIVAFMCYFIFGFGVHENHAFLPALLAPIWAVTNRARYLEAVLLAVMFNLNLLMFFGIAGNGLGFSRVVGVDVTILLSAFNIVIFGMLWLPIAANVLFNLNAMLRTGISIVQRAAEARAVAKTSHTSGE